jgi:UDP-N-acetylmuramoyl-tripeptide--D-alanyl-D-alanine ligase
MFKRYIQHRLERYVKKYLKRHPNVKVVIVAGSVGKTITKLAIGTVLNERLKVRLHEGNHNAELSAPLAMLGIDYPEKLRSLGTWRLVFKAARERIRETADIDVIVQEVGTDRIGQVPHFGTYVKPDLAVITAVTPEHMEYFKTLDVVAAEELAAANYSKAALINRDDIDGTYAVDITNPNLNTYGSTDAAEYHFIQEDFTPEDGYKGSFKAPEWEQPVEATVNLLGEHNLRAAVAAGAVGLKLGLTAEEVGRGLAKIRPVNGRMNVLRGVEKTMVIDDTYNASPSAVASAIQTLYQLSVPQRVLVIGDMAEMGTSSPAEHQAIGKLCDPTLLAHVITVGNETAQYLAPAAQANGCHVVSFKSALEAGGYAHKVLEPGAVILFKGSQNGIFLEEAVKVVLHSTDEEAQLVRQDEAWMEKKRAFFESLA